MLIQDSVALALACGKSYFHFLLALGTVAQSERSLASQGSVVIVSASGTKRMNEAAREAIRAAAPFGHFPDSVKTPSVDLLFSFYFDKGASEPKQEPRVVPAAI